MHAARPIRAGWLTIAVAFCRGLTGIALAAPQIDSISPSQGPIVGGTVVTISGSGFTPDTTVRFNRATGINVHVLSSSQVQVTTPPLGGGPFATALSEVRATNSSGEGYAEFLYLPPSVDEIRPGDVTTIAGVGN